MASRANNFYNRNKMNSSKKINHGLMPRATAAVTTTTTTPAARSHAAASQFEQLSREKDALTKATGVVDRQRNQLEKRLQELRSHQTNVNASIRTAQDELGKFHREKCMLTNEISRLTDQLSRERKEFETCVQRTIEMKEFESNHKDRFWKDMDQLNTELSDILVRQEDLRLQRMLSVDTAPVLVDFYREKQQQQRHMKLQKHQHRDDEDDDNDEKALTELEGSVQKLKQATEMSLKSLAEVDRVTNQVKILRASALQSDKNLTEENLLELEAIWEQNYSGASDNNEDGSNDEENQDPCRPPPSQKSSANPAASVHLDLFYGNIGGKAASTGPAVTLDEQGLGNGNDTAMTTEPLQGID